MTYRSGFNRERLHIHTQQQHRKSGAANETHRYACACKSVSDPARAKFCESKLHVSVDEIDGASTLMHLTCMCLTRGDMHLNIEWEHMASEAASVRADTASEYLHGLSLAWREERGVPRKKLDAVTCYRMWAARDNKWNGEVVGRRDLPGSI